MHTYYSSQFKSSILTIHPGEHYASGDDILISTLLGSCITVTLFDPVLKSGGMNHFMLPHPGIITNPKDENGKYGVHAMELLINDLFKLGCRKERLQAKVFGGGTVLSSEAENKYTSIPRGNIDFAFSFLNNEEIPLISSDTGGKKGRKIYFHPVTGKVYLQNIERRLILNITENEKKYVREIQKEKTQWGKTIIF